MIPKKAQSFYALYIAPSRRPKPKRNLILEPQCFQVRTASSRDGNPNKNTIYKWLRFSGTNIMMEKVSAFLLVCFHCYVRFPECKLWPTPNMSKKNIPSRELTDSLPIPNVG